MPQRAFKTDDEIAAVPLDQEILIELPGGDIDLPEPEGKAKRETSDPDAKGLQQQLEALQKAQKASDDRALEAERRAAEATRLASERERELAEQRTRNTALEGDVITGGLASAQSERDAAKAAFKAAFEAGDADAMANAQSRMGRAEAKILTFEAGAAEIAERPKPESRQQQGRQSAPDPLAAMRANPNLMPAEKQWLDAHPDAITDARRNNELNVAYEKAIKKGLARGTPEYFEYLESFMDYSSSNDDNQRSTNVQAPPSRNERGGDGRPTNGKITLEPEQREMARNLGVSEIAYAQNLVKFQAAQKSDPDRYGSR